MVRLLALFVLILFNITNSYAESNVITCTGNDVVISGEHNFKTFDIRAKNCNVVSLLKVLNDKKEIIYIENEEDLSIHNVDINLSNMSVKKVLNSLVDQIGYGGYLSLKGKGQKIYLTLATASKQLNEEIDVFKKVKDKEKIDPNYLMNWLITFYETFGIDDPAMAGIYVSSVLQYLNDNYEKYQDIILSIISDEKLNSPVKLAMIDVSKGNFSSRESKVYRSAFMNDTSAVIRGRTAFVLSENGVDISKNILGRMPCQNHKEEFYYYLSLGNFKSIDIFKRIKNEIKNKELNRKNSKIFSSMLYYIDNTLSHEDEKREIIDTILEKKYSGSNQIYGESVKIECINSLSKIGLEKDIENLLNISSNNSFSPDVRITSLHGLLLNLSKFTDKNKKMYFKLYNSFPYGNVDSIDNNRFKLLLDRIYIHINSGDDIE